MNTEISPAPVTCGSCGHAVATIGSRTSAAGTADLELGVCSDDCPTLWQRPTGRDDTWWRSTATS